MKFTGYEIGFDSLLAQVNWLAQVNREQSNHVSIHQYTCRGAVDWRM